MLSDHRPAELHGAKVGVASVITAGWYAQVARLSKDQAQRRLDHARLPDPQEEVSKIRAIFGPIAGEILPTQEEFLSMTGRRFEDLKTRILDCWQDVQGIAAGVPSTKELARWLRMVGGPSTTGELNLAEEEIRLALDYSHYMRKRFTINKLRILLGIA
jgi:glycerol-1-phosphate dehydrogenase [NAD(P)+]